MHSHPVTEHPAKRVALQKGRQEPHLATQRRGPTPAGCETTEVTWVQEYREGFFRLTLPTTHGARAYIPAAQPHSPRWVLGMTTPWAVSLGGTLALPAGRSSAPPLPAWLGPPTAGWLGAHVASRLWSSANPAEPTPRPAPCAPRPGAGHSPPRVQPGRQVSAQCPKLPAASHNSPAIPESF